MTTYDLDALRRREYPWAVAGESIYLNHASTGAMPQRTVDALIEWARMRANPERISQELQFGTLARARELTAKLIGAEPGEIAVATNTSHGINLAAFSLPLGPGDVVLTPDLEFPANVYPWIAAAERRGFEYRRIPLVEGIADTETVLAALEQPGVRALSVSWVGFATGAMLDIARLGAACRERGIWFVVDAIQGLGAMTLDLSRVHVDILSAGAQKWLLSPWGAGFVYVRKALVQQLEPHDVSWLDVRGSDDFTRLLDYDMTWRDDARRFEFVTVPFQDYAGMVASLEMLLELGPAAVESHIRALADRIVDWCRARSDVRLVTPAEPERRAGIVCFRPRDARTASDRLRAQRVAHSLREGAIRLAPHCYNTPDEIDRALALID
ncbi:MAG TPA: aminotransferase class V-fold PLP-dependent enzyme [Gemmatimonadaceae bacterium]|nr:aminotransferase class V-fold PLP-dependent enzyme [Gemmatimonadaceae bacterium]